MRELRLSASSNADFLSCQLRYLLGYVYGLKVDKEKESLRVGSKWHKLHELLELKPESFCPRCAKREEVDPVCYICEGTGRVPENRVDVVTRHLNEAYATTPDNMTADDWALERTNLLYSLVGHQWYYAGKEREFEVIGSEIKFELPVFHGDSTRRLPKVTFVCKVDRLVREVNTGMMYVWERKSTARPLNEDYWQALTQGDQITGYIYGARMAQKLGLLAPYGVGPDDTPIAGAFCDVWHKPTIKPKMLSQKDTKVLLETGEYFGEKFEVKYFGSSTVSEKPPVVTVNGDQASIVEGKQGIAVHETPAMFGARLLSDISERPEFYFQQRVVGRTDQELRDFGVKLPKIARQIRYVELKDLWLPSLGSCNATFRCEFCDLCRSGVKYQPGDNAPAGYKLGWGSTPPVPTVGTEIELG